MTKTAIIIGGTSGIGRGVAELLVKDGFRVAVTGRRTELLAEIMAENPDRYITEQSDASDTDNLTGVLDNLTERLGNKLDLIFISAGMGDINESLDFEIEKQTIDLNVGGFTLVADWAFRLFKKQGFGHLVAISSIAGLRGSAESPAYNASKAYQISYLEALAIKARKIKLPIIVTDIRPGLVDTAMAKGDGLFWLIKPEKACRQIYKAITQKRRKVYIDGRWAMIARILKNLPFMLYRNV